VPALAEHRLIVSTLVGSAVMPSNSKPAASRDVDEAVSGHVLAAA
jgi:hypothetical protein